MSSAYLQCIEEGCQQRQDPKKDSYLCSTCGGLLEVKYEFDAFDPEERINSGKLIPSEKVKVTLLKPGRHVPQ